MQKKSFQVQGITEYVFSKFIPDSKVPKTDEAMTKSAMEQVYANGKGELFVPARQIKGALKTAINLADMKLNKSKSKALQIVSQIVFVEPGEIPIINGKKRLTVKDVLLADTPCEVGMGLRRQMIMKRRAYIKPGYTLQFEIHILAENLLNMSYMETALNNASILASIGGSRNQGKGRFEVL